MELIDRSPMRRSAPGIERVCRNAGFEPAIIHLLGAPEGLMKPVAVTALPKYKLQVEYADGVAGEVDLSHLVGKGVFAAWNDRAAFEAVAIGDQGEFQWSDDIDLCSDAIYLEITGKSAEDLFPGLKIPADA